MANFTDNPILTDRYSEAVTLALFWHRRQVRKQGTPYVSHLLQVSGLVIEHGGTEDEAIAAVLHDSYEDVNTSIEYIRTLFGDNVAEIVRTVSEDKTLPRDERKVAYVQSIANGSKSAALVSCADKLHNLRCYANQPELLDEGVCLFYCKLIPEYVAALCHNHLMVLELKEILIRKILPQVSTHWVLDSDQDSFPPRFINVENIRPHHIFSIKQIAETP